MDYILNIKKIILEKKTKTYELANFLKVSPNTINNWLGERNPLPMPAYIGICDYYVVDYGYFLTDNMSEKKLKPQEMSEFEKIHKENNLLKDKIIRLQEELYEKSKLTLNEK
jgi:transcriptional regulator with XRE-family HTH domain